MLELLFDHLLQYNDWFWLHRRSTQNDLIVLGSDPNNPWNVKGAGWLDQYVNTMQGARLESGMDNSPMYDGEYFDKASHQMLQVCESLFLYSCVPRLPPEILS